MASGTLAGGQGPWLWAPPMVSKQDPPEGLEFALRVPEALTQLQHPWVPQVIQAEVQLHQALVHTEGAGQVFTGSHSELADLQPTGNPVQYTLQSVFHARLVFSSLPPDSKVMHFQAHNLFKKMGRDLKRSFSKERLTNGQ